LIVTVRRDDEIPSDNNEMIEDDFTFSNGFFLISVYVDLREGEVWEISQANFSGDGTTFRFTDIPCYDSPMLITDRNNIVLRRQPGL